MSRINKVAAGVVVGCGLLLCLTTGCLTPSTPHTGTLLDAARAGNLAEVQWHLKRGENVNVADEKGMTPLMWAAFHEKTESAGESDLAIVKALIGKGAAIDAKNLIDWTPLIMAVFRGDANVAKVLLDKGANANAQGQAGQYTLAPLDFAVINKRPDLEILLKQYGAEQMVQLAP